MSKVLEITESNFQSEVMENSGLVMVDFWATWCGPCRRMSPIVDQIAEEDHPGVTVGKVDVDAAQALAARYGISSIPTILFFKNGQVVEQLVGASNKGRLTDVIAKNV